MLGGFVNNIIASVACPRCVCAQAWRDQVIMSPHRQSDHVFHAVPYELPGWFAMGGEGRYTVSN